MMLRASKILLFSLCVSTVLLLRVHAEKICTPGDSEIGEIGATGYINQQMPHNLFAGDFCVPSYIVERGIVITYMRTVGSGFGGIIDGSVDFYCGNENDYCEGVFFYKKYDQDDVPDDDLSAVRCSSDLIANNWSCNEFDKSQWKCEVSYGFFRDSNFELKDSSDETLLINRNGYYCKLKPYSISVIEYDKGIQDNKIHICTENYVKGKILEGDYYGGGSMCSVGDIAEEVFDRCCPADRPYLVDPPFHVTDWGDEADNGTNKPRCYSEQEIIRQCGGIYNTQYLEGLGAASKKPDIVQVYDPGAHLNAFNLDNKIMPGNGYFEEPNIPTYICGNGNCTINVSTKIVLSAFNNNYYAENFIEENNLGCVLNKSGSEVSYVSIQSCSLLNGTNDNCICLNGFGFSEFYANLIGEEGAEILNNCSRMPEDQTGQCQECFLNNWVLTSTDNTHPFTWSSSLGCVDTRTNPFITRIIQIGLGIGSGVAVIRIIQGAFMRQTNDPSKIQEGNEIIVSTIMALVVLAGAVLILQIIGVNILGIFSQGDFDAIISVN